MDDLATYAENTWCPGCGNFGILAAAKQAVRTLAERGTPRERLVMVTGIGQHGKMFDYLAISGFYALHGRDMATAQGIKLANPDLKVFTFSGDGDAFGEGLEHMLFAAKRNADISIFVHDNGVYGLTTGQATPLTRKGYRGPSTPGGSVEEPFNPLTLMLEAGATFVARGFAGNREQLADLMVQAIEHEGCSFVDILQPCVTFNDTWQAYRSLTTPLEAPAASLEEALAVARRTDRLPLGVVYRQTKPVYHRELQGDRNLVRDHPARQARVAAVERLLA